MRGSDAEPVDSNELAAIQFRHLPLQQRVERAAGWSWPEGLPATTSVAATATPLRSIWNAWRLKESTRSECCVSKGVDLNRHELSSTSSSLRAIPISRPFLVVTTMAETLRFSILLSNAIAGSVGRTIVGPVSMTVSTRLSESGSR